MYEAETAEALGELNKGRQALDLPPLAELPKGELSCCYRCVVARGLELMGRNARCGSAGVAMRTESEAVVLGVAWGTRESVVPRAQGSEWMVSLPACLAQIAGNRTPFAATLNVSDADEHPLVIDLAYFLPDEPKVERVEAGAVA